MTRIQCLLFLFVVHVSVARAQNISTIAGDGTPGYLGDGSDARGCELNNPFGIYVYGSNLYITDRHNNRVRMIDGSGVITTIAGTGVAGYNGDNIPATAAELNSPTSVAVDAYGNVFICDQGNNRIRCVASGIITTYVGDGVAGYAGDNGPVTAARLNSPRGIAVNPLGGTMFIADQGNNRVRKIDRSADLVTTVAGNGTAGYSGDGGPATNAALKGPYAVVYFGGLYIADVDNERIRVVINDTIRNFAGNGIAGYGGDIGPATAAMLNEPIGLALSPDHAYVYIADGWNGRVRQVDRSGIISTIAGNGTLGYGGDGGPAVDARLNDPYGVAVDGSGNIFIADYANNRIRHMTKPTAVPIVPGAFSSLSVYPDPSDGNFFARVAIVLDEPLRLTITDMAGQTIKELAATTNAEIGLSVDTQPGIYILTAATGHEVWHKQVLKLK